MRAQALFVLFPGCVWAELGPALAVFSRHFDVRVASPSGEGVRVEEGLRIHADLSFATARDGRFAAVVVPGGELDSVKDDEALSSLLRAHAEHGVVGGICNGALLLARAGLLSGRRATHTAHARYAPRPAFDALYQYAEPILVGTTYVDDDVVVDGRVVTAKPWAAIPFAEQVAVLAGMPAKEAGRAASYLRGDRFAEPIVRYAIELSRVAGAPRDLAVIRAHVEHLRELDRRGALVYAGPYADSSGGLVVVRAGSLEEAEAVAARDPFVVAGVRTVKTRAWELSSEANGHLGVLDG